MNWPSRATAAAREPSLAAAPPPVVLRVATVADAITTLLPGPPSRTSCPPPPISTSSPLPPVKVSLPGLPTRTSSPSPPLAVSSMPLTAEAIDDDAIVRLEVGDRHRLGQARHRDDAVVVHDRDRVVAVGRIDDDRVRRAVAAGAAGLCAQVDSDLVDAGSRQIVDCDGVGTTSGVDLDVLDAVEVHGDVADVAGEPRAAAIGRDVDVLGDVGAVEQERVGARLPFDGVAAVARIPDERVVARAEQGRIAALPADDEVVAPAAGDRVVAGTAVDREIDLAGVKRQALMVSLPASPLMTS